MDWYDGLTVGKYPDSVLDYQFDWATWLGVDTISTFVVTPGTGLTVDTSSNTATTVDVWLSGGTLDAVYDLKCQITTVAGRVAERVITVDCGEAPGMIILGNCT